MKSVVRIPLILLSVVAVSAAFSYSYGNEEKPVKYVILMIADGWGYNHIAVTNHWNGVDKQVYEEFPVHYPMSTYSYTVTEEAVGYDGEEAHSNFRYLPSRYTDSAAAITAIATGVKGRDAQINIHPETEEPLFTVTERAEELGMATGIVTSVLWSHATPAGYAPAHNTYRKDYEGIAREMVEESACDVIMGAGHPLYDDDAILTDGEFFDEYGNLIPPEYIYACVGGQGLWEEITAGKAGGDADGDGSPDPWTHVENREDFLALMEGDTPKRVLGTARTGSTLQQMRTWIPQKDNALPPYEVPLNENVPTLAEMTRGALNVLDEYPDGFLLMVEGGAVDWACHGKQPGRMIEEMDDFNASVEAAIAWVDENDAWDETLLIVTGDHECGYLLGPGSGMPDIFTEVVDNGPGRLPGCEFYSSSHTNSLIPLYAKGRGDEMFCGYANEIDPELGTYIDNTEIAKVIFSLYDEVEAVR